MPRIALLQAAPRLGRFGDNLRALEDAAARLGGVAAYDAGVFPEAAVVGHPPQGLAYRVEFREDWRAARHAAAERFAGRTPEGCARVSLGDAPAFGDAGPAAAASGGARALLVDATRPYRVGLPARYEEEVSAFARRHDVWWLEANLAGGQDTTVHAGGSLVVAPDGAVRARARMAEADAMLFDLADDFGGGAPAAGGAAPPCREPEGLYRALRTAVRDYVDQSGAAGVAVGLSGGVDSAVVAALAADALGADRVAALTLPSAHTSAETRADALLLAENLGVRCQEASIAPLCALAARTLDPLADGAAPPGGPPPDPEDIAGQNVQARMRAVLLMGLANRLNLLVLNTSNKSEASVGYGTLYGDLIGGFAPIADVYKTQVWELGRYINARAGRERIPASTLARAPTAELRPGQLDADSLPPYEALDRVMWRLNEEAQPLRELIAGGGVDRDMVARALRLHFGSEYKRRQAVPAPRVQPSADWPERQLPILHGFFPRYLH